MEKGSDVCRGNNKGPKTLPWGTRDNRPPYRTVINLIETVSVTEYRQQRISDVPDFEPYQRLH